MAYWRGDFRACLSKVYLRSHLIQCFTSQPTFTSLSVDSFVLPSACSIRLSGKRLRLASSACRSSICLISCSSALSPPHHFSRLPPASLPHPRPPASLLLISGRLLDTRTAELSLKFSKGKTIVASGISSDTKATPWVENYRRQSLADVAAHRDIVDTIERLTSENKLPLLLLYEPPGTGKTSTILAVARKLYGNQFNNLILELNASDDRGIDVVRQQIQDFASTQSFSFGNVNLKEPTK